MLLVTLMAGGDMKFRWSILTIGLLAMMVACSDKAVEQDTSTTDNKAADPESSEIVRLTTAAEAGDSQAQVQLAKKYLKWNSATRNPDLAFKWYLAAAQGGNFEAVDGLIAMHSASLGPKQPDDFGPTWVKRAAEAGSPKHQAQYAQSLVYGGRLFLLSGEVSPLKLRGEKEEVRMQNGQELMRVLQAPAFKDSPDALYYRGLTGLLGLSADAANDRSGRDSRLIAIDRTSGLDDLDKAARQGSLEAQLSLAMIFDMGQVGFKRDPARALKYWDMLDAQKDADAQNFLGMFFGWAPNFGRQPVTYRGEALTESVARSLSAKWTRLAADQGNKDAMLRFARETRDPQGAFQYRLRAAQEGSFEGMLEVGRALLLGQGTIQDFAQAKSWLLQAAEDPREGSRKILSVRPEAQFVLGLAAIGSLGAPADAVIAHAWMNLANATGHEKAARFVGEIAQRLTTQELAEAQTLAREWQPGKDIVRNQHSAVESAKQEQSDSAAGLALAMTGTGAVINREGNVLTSAHVVTGCKDVRVTSPRKSAVLLVADKANDLAVLSLDQWSGGVADLNASESVAQGEEIVVFGFPLGELLPSSGNMTTGVVSSLAGVGNNATMLQITAPVQPGNSGGPLLNRKAQIVGVVVSKADAVKIARVTGDIPQNVNFAVSLPTVKSFLNANHVNYTTSRGLLVREKSPADLALLAQTFVLKLECWK